MATQIRERAATALIALCAACGFGGCGSTTTTTGTPAPTPVTLRSTSDTLPVTTTGTWSVSSSGTAFAPAAPLAGDIAPDTQGGVEYCHLFLTSDDGRSDELAGASTLALTPGTWRLHVVTANGAALFVNACAFAPGFSVTLTPSQ